MRLFEIRFILFITQNPELIELLTRLSKRLGAQKIQCCLRQSEALNYTDFENRPDLIIEEIEYYNEESLLPYKQEMRCSINHLPIPVFAIISPKSKADIQLIEDSDYIGYEIKPINESLLEQKIRDIYYENQSYIHANMLADIIQQNISQKNIKTATRYLLPALNYKKQDLDYILLYGLILFEKGNLSSAEKIINSILTLDPDNIKAKNILTKILIKLNKFQDNDKLKT